MSSKSDRDNRSNQLNPNNSAYASSRAGGYDDEDYGSSSYRFTGTTYHAPETFPIWRRESFILDVLFEDETSAHFVVEAGEEYMSSRTDIDDMLAARLRSMMARVAQDAVAGMGRRVAFVQLRSSDQNADWLHEWDGLKFLKRDLAWASQRTRDLYEAEFAVTAAQLAKSMKALNAHVRATPPERTIIKIDFPLPATA
ncbi:hypothetical protein [Paracidovorax wautersii]|uniref:Uncharacterized protein n=1 Tax=Paracidovorax wautersii TaxID=1177982 RepID=A0ABU1IHX2_9BURK|nr:hypothetical protein [Paracidovorax wautersii]MDR6216188.1 hypothetical protein [Paracidovorax wautersii]